MPGEKGELSASQLERMDSKQKPMTMGERLRNIGLCPTSETNQEFGRPTELQFMKEKTRVKETCQSAVKPCLGCRSIVKQVEFADGKLPKSPAPSFVVPTFVSSGFFCQPFYP